jgi:hypothetical protein
MLMKWKKLCFEKMHLFKISKNAVRQRNNKSSYFWDQKILKYWLVKYIWKIDYKYSYVE